MGGSISTGHGASIVLKNAKSDRKVVSVIGDSTFYHTGINSLMNVAYNGGNNLTIICDNRITAMTGHQDHPGTGYSLMGEPAPEVDLPMLLKAIGIKEENIAVVNPLKLDETEEAIDRMLAKDEPTVVVTKYPCILKKFSKEDLEEFDMTPKLFATNREKCKKCKMCMKTGCPAINKRGDEVLINEDACIGCAICAQVCKFGAIEEVK